MLQAAREACVCLFGGLHNAVLRGAQFLGVLVQHGLQLLATALAQCGKALALAYIEHQQGCSEPEPASGNGGPVAAGLAMADVVQQVQLPWAFRQRRTQPQHRLAQPGLAEAGQPAGSGGLALNAVAERLQGLVGVLMGVQHLLLITGGEGLQQAVAPFVIVGEKDHAMLVRCKHDVGGLAPLAFQFLKQDFDSY